MDPIGKAKAQMGGIEKLISGLPGIKGYREKEIRRDADKQVRVALAQRLVSRRAKLTALQNDLLDAGGILWVDDMERAVGRLQLFIDRVRTASYGYAPLFGLNRVKEQELDLLVQFDQSLFEQVGGLDEAIAGLEKAVHANEGIREALAAVGAAVNGLNDTFGRRADVIQNAGE